MQVVTEHVTSFRDVAQIFVVQFKPPTVIKTVLIKDLMLHKGDLSFYLTSFRNAFPDFSYLL